MDDTLFMEDIRRSPPEMFLKPVVNKDFNYQPQLVISPDFFHQHDELDPDSSNFVEEMSFFDEVDGELTSRLSSDCMSVYSYLSLGTPLWANIATTLFQKIENLEKQSQIPLQNHMP